MSFPERILLLDLETTGLNREQDFIISIGLSYLDASKKMITTSWFLENPEEEKALLIRFLEWISNYDALFSYYGKGFEFPFILARLQHYDLDPSLFLGLKLIDMKNALKHFSKDRHTLETLLGYKRHCQSTGHDIVKLYRTYLTSKASIYKSCILEHQKEELESLLLFWELYTTLLDNSNWQLLSQTLEAMQLTLTLKVPSSFSHTFLGHAFDLSFSYLKDEAYLVVKIPVCNDVLQHTLEPLKDYYYIESQGQLLHKSLAQFIPATLKRKATKDECVITKEGTFIPVATSYKLSVPLWHDANQKYYIEYSDFSLEILQTQVFYLFFQGKSKKSKA